MEQVQTNRVTMFKTVAATLDQNNPVWNSMTPMAEALQRFRSKINTIDEAARKQETSTAGAAGDKSAAREALESVLFLTCQALGVLARKSKDNELMELTAVTPTDLRKLGSEELSRRATTVRGKANDMKTELATLLVTQANLDELDHALQAFQATKEKPRTVVADRVAQTASLATLIDEANDILRNEIDPLVNLFMRSNSEFVAAYRSARVIIDRKASHGAAPPTPPTQNP
jgi:hypothetical protein